MLTKSSILYFLLVLVFIYIGINMFYGISIPDFIDKDDEMYSEITSALNCLENTFNSIQRREKYVIQQWYSYASEVKRCTENIRTKIPAIELRNKDETKRFIELKNSEEDFIVVTLGIGKDVVVETGLKSRYSKGKFYGVDLDDEISGKMYTIDVGGKFLKGLVGAKEGTYKASVLEYNGENGYQDHELKHYSFKQVLQEFNITKFNTIDYLLMDIEGDEFELMTELATHPAEYPTICQIDVEYHNPRKYKPAGYKVIKLHEKMAHDGIYLYYDVETPSVFHRSYYVNVMNPICLKKYLGMNL